MPSRFSLTLSSPLSTVSKTLCSSCLNLLLHLHHFKIFLHCSTSPVTAVYSPSVLLVVQRQYIKEILAEADMPVPSRQGYLPRTTALPSKSGPFDLSDPNNWLDEQQFWTLGAISLFLMLGPFLIWQFWDTINSWGWWKPGAPRNSHRRQHYIRTWHGWVTAEHHQHGMLRRQAARNKVHRKLAWKTSKADYSWIFWDPNGEGKQAFEKKKQPLAKWLPAWVRSWEFGRVAWRRGDEMLKVQDLEQGLNQTRSTFLTPEINGPCPTEASRRSRHGSAHSGSGQYDGFQDRPMTTTFSPWVSGGDLEAQNTGTLRRRAVQRASQAWMIDSMEIEVFETQQCFGGPPMGVRSTELPTATAVSMLVHRAQSLPVMPSTNTVKDLARASSLPTLSHAFPEHSKTLYRARPIDGPSAPNSSEDVPTPRGFTPKSGEMTVRFGSVRANSYDPRFLRSLDRSLQAWAQPLYVNPFASTGPEYCGTAGRRGSPAMGWVSVGAGLNEHLEDMRGYEAEGSLSYAGSTSSSLSDSWAPFPKHGLINPDRLPSHNGNDASKPVWHKNINMSGSKRAICGYGENFQVSDPNSNPKWYEKYRQVSVDRPQELVVKHISHQKPDRAIEASPFDSPSTPQRPKRSISSLIPINQSCLPSTLLDGRHSVSVSHPRRHLSLPEQHFLDALQRKLTWLCFELSPGFRGPEDNPAESWKAPLLTHSRLSGNVVSRATETQKRTLTRSGARRTQGPVPTTATGTSPDAHTAQQTQYTLDEFRTAMNALRACSRRLSLSLPDPDPNPNPNPSSPPAESDPTTLLRPATTYFEADALEPAEADIDTAAWILRRPPQGFEPTAAGVNAYYTGVKGYAEKMWEWEAVRRPYVLERMVRKHDGLGHDGVGGKVWRGVGKVLGVVREGERRVVGGDGEEEEEEEVGPDHETSAAEGQADGPAAEDDATSGSESLWDADAYERGSMRDHSLSGSDW